MRTFLSLIIILRASLAYLASCTCNETHGRATLEYDDVINDYIWDEDYIELELCCNETTLEASWKSDDVWQVRKLEYSCSNNQSGLLARKNSISSAVKYAEINGAYGCNATLSYLDFNENLHHISTSCTIAKDLCSSNPCQTHERCSSDNGMFKCTCHENFDSNCIQCEHGYQFSDDQSECVCQDGDLRLVDGESTTEGQVELCMGNKFGAICDTLWGKVEARVVCGLLGFNNDSLVLPSIEVTSSLVHVNGIQCFGNETSLLSCNYNKSKSCSNSRAVGVKCGVVSLTPIVNGSTQSAIIGTTKKIWIQYVAVGIVVFIGFVGCTITLVLTIIVKRNHSHERHKVQIDKYFSQALDVNFEPIDFVYNVPVSISLQSVTTAICPMEKENFTRMNFASEGLEASRYHSIVKISDMENKSLYGSHLQKKNSPESNRK